MPRTQVTGTQIAPLELTTEVAGVLPVANGGTGASSQTMNGALLGNGTGALQSVSPGTSGNVLRSNGTTWTSAALTSGSVVGSANNSVTQIVTITQAAYNALGAGRPSTTLYVIVG